MSLLYLQYISDVLIIQLLQYYTFDLYKKISIYNYTVYLQDITRVQPQRYLRRKSVRLNFKNLSNPRSYRCARFLYQIKIISITQYIIELCVYDKIRCHYACNLRHKRQNNNYYYNTRISCDEGCVITGMFKCRRWRCEIIESLTTTLMTTKYVRSRSVLGITVMCRAGVGIKCKHNNKSSQRENGTDGDAQLSVNLILARRNR